MDDSTLSLAFSMYNNAGVYAVLVGSGVSTAAGIPTGWEIVLDLCHKIATLYGEDAGDAPDEWYRAKFGEPPRYDDLLQKLAATHTERNRLLFQYFDPTDEERERGLKMPTHAHKAIARLAKGGYVRMILTTNFDRLIETALEEAGVPFDVVSSDDAILGARPYVHSSCMVVKLHGDYKDTRIKNTKEELAAYSSILDALIDRVFDEFGLMLAGWSATWDVALRAAMLRCPSQRYGWYWLTRSDPTDEAMKLIRHRTARVIAISDANEFFLTLADSVEALQKVKPRHPLSADIAVARTKKFLSEDRFRIELHDLVFAEVSNALRVLQGFPAQTGNSPSAFKHQLGLYVTHTAIVRGIIATLAFFGNAAWHQDLVRTTIERLSLPRRGASLTAHLPGLSALLAMYSAGVAAVGARRFDNLRSILVDTNGIDEEDHQRVPMVAVTNVHTVFGWVGRVYPAEFLLSSYSSEGTVASEYLLNIIRPTLKQYLPTESEYAEAFQLFEFLLGLVYLDRVRVSEGINDWAPCGVFTARRSSKRLIEDFLRDGGALGDEWPILAHLSGGNRTRFEQLLHRYEDFLAQVTTPTTVQGRAGFKFDLVAAYEGGV